MTQTDTPNTNAPLPQAPDDGGLSTVALIGNPNAGKTRLFNALTGLRAKTANFPGTTVDFRMARLKMGQRSIELLDLPGLYGLEAVSEDERIAARALTGELKGTRKADAVVVVIDATNLERGLFLASETIGLGRPTVVALNMIDLANRSGAKYDVAKLSAELGCRVVAVSARTGDGLEQLQEVLEQTLDEGRVPEVPPAQAACASCGGCPFTARYDWAEAVASTCGTGPAETHGRKTENLDRALTHPIVGVILFISVMLGLFYVIFSLATYPMDMIEAGFAVAGDLVARAMPPGDMRSLVVDGMIGGVGGVLVFLPQIAILFFFITLLEDSGYLARAAFVMDRMMSKVGLPGKAFVPMLSAHACAIPAIMSTRIIDDWRDRLVTILVLPLLTCSARLPVYTMLAMLLFADSPAMAALMFTGAYALGVSAALVMALVFKKTILRGESRPLVIDLPNYRVPSLRAAIYTTWERSILFVKKAGTVILVISVVLWAMATYPKMPEDQLPQATATQIEQIQLQAESNPDQADALVSRADNLYAQAELEYSMAGRLGKFAEPVFDPLGFDWKINVGVISSFAAREVIVSTLGIVYGIGEEAAEETVPLTEALANQTYSDGSPVFDLATCLSLLVFYVLAMQCLPTQVITKRETGRWSWAIFQLGYMTVLAYSVSLITYQVVSAITG